jgi:uncharacterized membrane protein
MNLILEDDKVFPQPTRPLTFVSSLLLLVSAIAGLLVSFQLLVEKYRVLGNPGYLPSCTLSETIDCGTVVSSWQSTVFGFPNPIIGLIAYTIVFVLAVLSTTRIGFPRWVWVGLFVGSIVGIVFVHWLAWQTAYVLQAVCVYCVVAWISTLTILGTSTNILLKTRKENTKSSTLVSWVPVLFLAWGTLLAVFVVFGLSQ